MSAGGPAEAIPEVLRDVLYLVFPWPLPVRWLTQLIVVLYLSYHILYHLELFIPVRQAR